MQEVTTTSWGSRIVGAVTGILFGIGLFIGAFVLIWWNEGRSVERIKTLKEGRELVLSVASDGIDAANLGKLVHFSGEAEGDEYLADESFGLMEEDVLKLKRIVEMYQWEQESHSETEKNMGGSETTKTTYSYKKTWSDSVIDSSEFKQATGHENPADMPFENEEMVSAKIYVGEFALSDAFVDQIQQFDAYPLTESHAAAMDESLKDRFDLYKGQYVDGDPATPKIGDLRVSYMAVKPQAMSVVGKQTDDGVEPYRTKHGTVELLQAGEHDADAMFAMAESENKLLTWILRAGGVLIMWIGMMLILRPISVLGDVVPFIGSLLGAGLGLVSGVVALVLSFTTMALAWLFYRPLIGGILLVVAAALLFGGFKAIKARLRRPTSEPISS